MINKVFIQSRPVFLETLTNLLFPKIFPNQKLLFISVYGDEYYSKNPQTEENLKFAEQSNNVAWMTVCFRDYGEKEELGCSYRFNEDMAKSVISFLDQNKALCDTLIVHCDAGMSRSSAIGLWANRYLGLDEKTFMVDNPRKCPNVDALSILMEVSGLNDSYKDFWEKKILKKS